MKQLSIQQSASSLISDINDNFAAVGKGGRKNNPIRVLHYNFGLFSLGGTPTGGITTEAKRVEAVKRWHHIFQKTGADIVLGCECPSVYARVDGAELQTVSGIFGDFVSANQAFASYAAKCLASYFPLLNVQSYAYTNRKPDADGRTALIADVVIGGRTVRLIETHLDFGSTAELVALRQAQIEETIALANGYDYAIIGGDFNNDTASEFNIFKTYSFSMANGSDMFGVINTYPSGITPNQPIDNVITKGLTINSVTLINEPELTDHCGLAVELEFNEKS